MALPKLNDVPLYKVTIPSNGRVVDFRPFLIKEQKVLLVAYESQDQNQVINAILQTIDACTNGAVETRKLTTIDVDYMFTQIRAKSVGEGVTLNLKCDKCEGQTEVSINLEDIKPPQFSDKPMVVELTKDIKVKMKTPTYLDILTSNNFAKDTDSQMDLMLKYLLTCMDSIQTEEENILLNDEPYEEKLSFLESLSTEQFGKLTQFLTTIPRIEHIIDVNCESCGEKIHRVLEGVDNFF